MSQAGINSVSSVSPAVVETAVRVSGLTASFTEGFVQITSTANNFLIDEWNPGGIAVTGLETFNGSVDLAMTAGDAAQISVMVSGSTKSISISGVTGPITTWFTGYLIC